MSSPEEAYIGIFIIRKGWPSKEVEDVRKRGQQSERGNFDNLHKQPNCEEDIVGEAGE